MMKPLDDQRTLSGRILRLGAFLPLLLLLLSPITAQTTSPPATTKGEYANVNNTFYIQGGSLSVDGTQLTPGIFSLDLTVPWNDQSPPWTTLPYANSGVAPLALQQSMIPTGDKSQLVIWNVQRYQITNFQLSNHIWGPTLSYSTNNINWGGLHGVIPPTGPGVLGTIHLPNGCWNLTQTASSLCTYNLDTLAWIQTPMPTGYLPTDVSYYSFVYSNVRNSIVMYGGTSFAQQLGASPYLYEYLPATKTWSYLQAQAKGTLPGSIYSHCMVESTDYSKMIMFGGAIGTSPVNVIGSLFILDLATLTWSQGADAPQAQFRLGHACAVNGDSFVVWGGSNLTVMMSNTPLIYNIRLNQWVNDFVVSGALPTTSPGSRPSGGSGAQPTGQPTTEKSSSSNIGGIIGGVVGGVVVLAAIGFFFYRRSRKTRPISEKPKVDEDSRSREYISRQDSAGLHIGGQSQWIPLHEADKTSPMEPSYFSNNKHDGSPFTYMQQQQQAVPPAIPPKPFQSPTTPTPTSPFSNISPYNQATDGSSYQTYQANTSYPGSPHANVHADTLLTSTSASPPKLSPRPNMIPRDVMGSYVNGPQAFSTADVIGTPTIDLRNPQALNARSMAMLDDPPVVLQSSSSGGGGGGGGGHVPYFSPPPPAPPSPPHSNLSSPSSSRGVLETVMMANDDVMAKKLALMKAQHEFELSRIRVEQETLAGRQRQGADY